MRKGTCRRETKETRIEAAVCLDGGPVAVDTGIGFFDHMLEAFAVHGGLGLTLKAEGEPAGGWPSYGGGHGHCAGEGSGRRFGE